MQLITTVITFLLASAFTVASPVHKKRDAAGVISGLKTLSSNVATLNSDALSYTGDLFQSITLAIHVNDLKTTIASTTTAATSSSAFSSTDSATITSAVSTLSPSITTLLGNLNAKASVVAGAGFTSTVLSALKDLTTATDALFAGLEAKATSTDAATLVTLQSVIDTAFAASQKVYS
ncbi:hydrophobic surface binding protein A-domain-containing protein [Tricladium varicosporioides]|nr:hydrophobic surface binding protein A-domain-containing protein [Hymenoscyphus varicosporioides]